MKRIKGHEFVRFVPWVVGVAMGVIANAATAQVSTRPGMGSMPYADANGTGVTFRVWAPHATNVGVKGQFSGWAVIPMFAEASGGLWSVDVPAARPGHEYKYRINRSFDRRDPRARQVTSSVGNSVIYNPNAFDWGDTPVPEPWRNDLVIYQTHIGTFAGVTPTPATFDQAIPKLDHLRDLGVNALKLMPVNEFAGSHSWGYNPADQFAIESSYGGPDAFKRFVKACHERGLAVFMDVVHNHYGPSDVDLWRFDGWYQNDLGGIYFYSDGRIHTPWGSTRPDYGRQEVRQFIRDQMFMFVDEFRVGGFRWDSVYTTIYSDWGHNQDGEYLLRDINWELLQTRPYVLRIAEDHAFDFSMNFETQWDVRFRWDLFGQIVTGSDAERDMHFVAGIIANNPGHHRLRFMEAHDYIARNHGRSRLPTHIFWEEPESIWSRKRSLLAAGIILTIPGIPMLHQGQEMLETQAFHDDTPLRWQRTNTFAGIVRAYTDMIRSRRNLRGGMQGLKGTGIHTHHVDNDNKVLAYIRWDQGGQQDDVVVVANFGATKWTNNNYSIQFPSAGTWYSHFNSDAQAYQDDFDNIGSAFVVASGSPPAANVNMGMYSLQIFSKEPPTGVGLVTLTPPAPSGCVPVTFVYDPGDGPLADATNVSLHLGRNGWSDVADLAMSGRSGGAWTTTVSVIEGTYRLDFSFFNGAAENPVWDNNEGRDWSVPVVHCAGLPGRALVSPESPHGCGDLTITYEPRDGVLAGSSNVFLHLGRNGWLNIQTLPMTTADSNTWIALYPIPESTWQVDFVVHDGAPVDVRQWDNNDGQDWKVFVINCAASELGGVAITSPASDITVPYTQEVVAVQGRAVRVQGALTWTNERTGEAGALAAVTNWALGDLPMDVGPNLIRVAASGDTTNLNAGSRDHATNPPYASGWTNGQTAGVGGFGPWSLAATEKAGHFRATAGGVDNLDSAAAAWGLWAYDDGVSEAIRPLADSLHPGDTWTVRLENSFIQSGGAAGFALQNRFGQNLLEFLFIGGGTNYVVSDDAGTRPTGIPWTGKGLAVQGELLSPTTYRLSVSNRTIEGTFAASSEMLARQLRLFNAFAGGGTEHNVYFSELAVDGEPLPLVEYQASRTVHRRYGPHFETLPAESNEIMRIRFPFAESGWRYDILYTTNLLSGHWGMLQENLQGDNTPLTVPINHDGDQLYLRTQAWLLQ